MRWKLFTKNSWKNSAEPPYEKCIILWKVCWLSVDFQLGNSLMVREPETQVPNGGFGITQTICHKNLKVNITKINFLIKNQLPFLRCHKSEQFFNYFRRDIESFEEKVLHSSKKIGSTNNNNPSLLECSVSTVKNINQHLVCWPIFGVLDALIFAIWLIGILCFTGAFFMPRLSRSMFTLSDASDQVDGILLN